MPIIKPSASISNNYKRKEKLLDLREKLIDIEKRRKAGANDYPAREVLADFKKKYNL